LLNNSSAPITDPVAKDENAVAKRIFDHPDNDKPGFFQFTDSTPTAKPDNGDKTLAEKLYPSMAATVAKPSLQPEFATEKMNADFQKQYDLTGDKTKSREYAINRAQQRSGDIQQLQNDFLASMPGKDQADEDGFNALDQTVDIGRGLLFGIARAGNNFNKLIPGMTQLGKLASDGAKAIGIDGRVSPPETMAGEFAAGTSQALIGVAPVVRFMKAAGYGTVVAEVAGGMIGDFATSGKDDAEGVVKVFDMVPLESTKQVSRALEDFINNDNATIEDLNARLVGSLPGAALGPLTEGLGKIFTAAKKSGTGSELLSSMKTRFNENSAVQKTRKAVKADTSSVIKLTGKELDEFSGMDLKNDVKSLRKSAVDYYNAKLLGTKVNNPQLGDIQFTIKGRKKFKTTSANPDKIKLLPAVPKFIKKAKIIASEDDPTGKYKKIHWLTGKIQTKDKFKEIVVSIKEDSRGKLFYNVNENNIPRKKSLGLSEKQARGQGSPVKDLLRRIIDDGSNVNLFFLTPLPLIAEKQNN